MVDEEMSVAEIMNILYGPEQATFEKEHPELRLNCSFVSDSLIRAEHPVILEEL